MPAPESRFPWWIPAGGLLLAALYLPTLATPFDFIDDGNLVYPVPTTDLGGHAGLWWDKVRANYEHLGPFRPTLWVHWQVQANVFGGDALAWRVYRLLWCGLAAATLLWLFRELGAHPVAALVAAALAMWNPYRNEIWTSLTLAEGVAMPYALFALVAARKAAKADRPLPWELGAALAVLVALGCKNTFAALVPAQIALRMWPEGLSLRAAWGRNGWRALALAVPLVLPAAHFVYFKQHWHPGQYETHAPSLAQFARIVNGLKGAMSLEFMVAGVVMAVAVVSGKNLTPQPPSRFGKGEHEASRPGHGAGSGIGSPLRFGEGPGVGFFAAHRPALLCAALLLAGGVAVYLPMAMISGRYAMPAVWGLDILFALLLTALVAAPFSARKQAAWACACGGLALVVVASVGKQEKFAARAKMLWDAVRYVEATTPPGAKVAWVSGDSSKGGLNVEEGIHFQWHLYHRGRGDVRVGLFDGAGAALPRAELPPLDGPAEYAVSGQATDEPAGWEPERTFVAAYWLGRRHYDCRLSRKRPAAFFAEAPFREMAREQLFPEMRP